jgi:general secretion pathway protein A
LALDEPLAQRVAVKYHLKSMTVETTTSYIRHRLQIAGARNILYDHDVIPLIHRYAGGVPRLINTISDNCLFEAYLCKMRNVDSRIAHRVAGDLGLLQQPLAGLQQHKVIDELNEIEAMLDQLEQKQ